MPKECIWNRHKIILILIVLPFTVVRSDPWIETSWLGSLLWATEMPPTGENLVIAAKEGNLDTVKDLVARGADVDYIYGMPLTLAAENGHFEVVKCLLEAGANPNGTDENRSYLGHVISKAAGNNHLDIIDLLLDAGATVRPEKYGVGVLDKAAENGHLEAVQRLLDAGADPDYGGGYTLLLAAKEGHLDVVKAFIEAGADVNAGKGWIISNAAEEGHLEVVRTLIEAGVDKKGLGYATESAASKGHLDIIKLLLEKGVDPSYGSILKSAAEFGDIEIVRILLEAGSNITYHAESGSPLHYAALEGHPDIIALLVEYGADINSALKRDFWMDFIPNSDFYGNGWTAMHTAARFGHPMTQALLELGADINIKDAKGRTPLQVAIFYGKLFVAKDLLRFCADLTPTNEEGKTALDMAVDLAAKNGSNTSNYQVLMTTLKEVMPEKIVTTPSNKAALKYLRNEFQGFLKANSTLREQLKDVETAGYDIESAFYFLFEERARRGMIEVIQGHGCTVSMEDDQGSVTFGMEYLVSCDCVPGQGPKMTYAPIQEANLCTSMPPLQDDEEEGE